MSDKKPVGKVIHYYDKIGVAVVRFEKPVRVGDTIQFKGANTDFNQEIASMQVDHKNIDSVKKGEEAGMKVDSRVREGDMVFEV